MTNIDPDDYTKQLERGGISVTNGDRMEASAAIIVGWNRCKRRPEIHTAGDDKPCTCDIGAIDGCKALREAIAESIAAARKA